MRGGLGRGFSRGEIEGRGRCERNSPHWRSGIVSFNYVMLEANTCRKTKLTMIEGVLASVQSEGRRSHQPRSWPGRSE